MKLARALVPAAVIGALLLTGCSGGSPSKDAAGVDCLAPGAGSDAIAVTGSVGEDLELTSETPVAVTELERTVLKEGEGSLPEEGDTLNIAVTMFNGANGEAIQQQPAGDIPFEKDQLSEWAYEALRCGLTGEQTALALPYEEIFGETPAEQTGVEGLSEGDSIVAIIEFGEPAATAVECESLEPRDEQYPEVDLGDGATEPMITIPECIEPPTELEIEVLVEGDGPVVEESQSVMTNYVGVDWNGGVRFDGNWSETGVEFSTEPGALIPGFTQAMVGQKVGSTVLVTIPPELGYDDGMTRTFVLQLVSIVE